MPTFQDWLQVIILLGVVCITIFFIILRRKRPSLDEDFVSYTVKKLISEELRELKGAVSNVATVLEIKTDLLEEKFRIRQQLYNEVNCLLTKILEEDSRRYFFKLADVLTNTFMFLISGSVSTGDQATLFESYFMDQDNLFFEVNPDIPINNATYFKEEYSKLRKEYLRDIRVIISKNSGAKLDTLIVFQVNFMKSLSELFL